jgi:23S rRNA pseudouridine2604 synthase
MGKKIIHIQDNYDQEKEIRLNKYLSEAGICSRREADRYIEEGRILGDGKKAAMGMKIRENQKITFDGKDVKKEEKFIFIAVNKPIGVVCTTSTKEKNNIIDYLNYPDRIFPVGRLDKNSEGLLLMTNNGDIVNKIMRAGNYHEKEYIVTVNKEVTEEFIAKMSSGVPVLDTVTRSCEVTKEGKFIFRIVLTQGLNRQIRRMCEYCGYKVLRLQRIRIMNICLGRLKPGGYRNVTKEEFKVLSELIKDSSSETVICSEDGRQKNG